MIYKHRTGVSVTEEQCNKVKKDLWVSHIIKRVPILQPPCKSDAAGFIAALCHNHVSSHMISDKKIDRILKRLFKCIGIDS